MQTLLSEAGPTEGGAFYGLIIVKWKQSLSSDVEWRS